MKFVTKATHSSYDCDEHNRMLISPIYQNSMLALHKTGKRVPYRYSCLNNPTRQALEDAITDLEYGAAGFAFSSGMVGIDVVWRTFLRPGNTIVAVVDIYGSAYSSLVDVYRGWGINVVFADLGNLDHLDELLATHNVKLVWLKTSSNPLLRLVGIKALAIKTHAAGTLVGVSNTFVTPCLQQPLEMGYGIVFHPAIECLCNHSDVLMGIVAVEIKEPAEPLYDMMVHTDTIADPIDCRLVLRGIKALALCMEAHCKNALDIIRRPEAHPAIEKVPYPDLPSHEHYELAKTQMPKGIGGMVTVYLKSDTREAADSVIKNMRLVKMASSLGGAKSLVNHCYPQPYSGMPHDVKMEVGIEIGLLRFSIGIEETDDIWNDISKALDSTL